MKSKTKSAFIIAALAALPLLGCTNAEGDGTSVFSEHDVPAEVLQQDRVVEVPAPDAAEQASYPRLGDVPSKPLTFSPQPVVDQAISEMQYERREAEKINRQPMTNSPPPYLLAPPVFRR